MYKILQKLPIPNRRAKILLITIGKLSLKEGFCYASQETLAKIMCCSIKTIKRAYQYLRENDYIIVKRRQRQCAITLVNYEGIRLKYNQNDPSKISVDKSVDKPVDNSILEGSFWPFNLQLYIIIKVNPLFLELTPAFLTAIFLKNDSHTAGQPTAELSKIEEIDIAIERTNIKPYACSSIYKKVELSRSNEQIDVIVEIGKFFNAITESRLNYNQFVTLLKRPVRNGLTYKIGVEIIRTEVFKRKENKCTIADIDLMALFSDWE